MKIKRLVILAGVLASFAASAQMPVLLLDGADTGGKAAVQAQAGKVRAIKKNKVKIEV